MSEEEIKKIAREEMLDTIKTKLDSSMIFTYINNLEQEKNKIKNIIKNHIYKTRNGGMYLEIYGEELQEFLEILGDKENE